MVSNKEGSDFLTNVTEEKLSELVEANDALDKEEARIRKEEIKEEERRRSDKKPFNQDRNENRYVLVIHDWNSKWLDAFPTKTRTTEETE